MNVITDDSVFFGSLVIIALLLILTVLFVGQAIRHRHDAYRRALIEGAIAAALFMVGIACFLISDVLSYQPASEQYAAAVQDRYGVTLEQGAIAELQFPTREPAEASTFGESEIAVTRPSGVTVTTVRLTYTGEHLILCEPAPDGSCVELPLVGAAG